ncbi:MAG TPA: ATP-binding protein, partial [Roseiflexaceae bacterium]|nr:ATP-binding protein [Roseiflexaceae bacterium]
NQAILEQHPLAGRVYVPGGALCPPEHLPLVRALREGIEYRNVELYLEQPDGGGGRIPILVTSVPLRDEQGFLQGAIAVFQDMRQLHEVERLKSDFVALVSHELRTPLTTIKGCTDTLLRGVALSDSARVREFVQIIDEQGERLQELIDNLLSLSQLEAGALRLRRELVAIPPILHGVVRQMADRLSSLRVQVEAPATLPLVSADARRIEQVVSNLLDNACKFSPEGGIVTVRAIVRDGNLIVSVSDQGPGIPPGEHEHVFERFYQVEQPATRQVGGSGLGLAICKSLIEAHGGQIWIDDSYTAGTAISFSLPAIPAEDSTQNANGVNLLAREVVGATHVLVVDDDPALRRILDSGLQDAGYQVRTVVEAQAAIEAVTQHI